MANKSVSVSEELNDYLQSVSLREPAVFRRLREETAQLETAGMQVAPEQGQLMALLLRLMGARRGIEVGVFTGYSALWLARALPEDGLLVACDVSEEWTAVARRYWREAGLDGRIDLHLRPAVETLDELLDQGGAGSFDFAFIDADKESYGLYYERCLKLMRPGGLIAVDNVLWSGQVIEPNAQDEETRAIRAFNELLRDDERIELAMLTVADGLTLAVKRDL
jgi:predicted O-methyltransferase YrrM